MDSVLLTQTERVKRRGGVGGGKARGGRGIGGEVERRGEAR